MCNYSHNLTKMANVLYALSQVYAWTRRAWVSTFVHHRQTHPFSHSVLVAYRPDKKKHPIKISSKVVATRSDLARAFNVWGFRSYS